VRGASRNARTTAPELVYPGATVAANAERLGRNEAFFREVNERIRDIAGIYSTVDEAHVYEFICECSATECSVRVRLTTTEYEEIRASATRFVLAPGHQVDEIETVVAQTPDHVVVEKIGAAGAIAEALDPRSA
jgi:hypothetical protein